MSEVIYFLLVAIAVLVALSFEINFRFRKLRKENHELCASLRSSDNMLNAELQKKTIRKLMAAKDLPPGIYEIVDEIVVVQSKGGSEYTVYLPSIEGKRDFKVLPFSQSVVPILQDGELEISLRAHRS